MKAELIPDNGDQPIPIVRDVTVIGRRSYCDVQIDHESLSKRHCVLVKTDGLLIIRDLATTNGTKVKGQKIRWAALLPDDRITLGGYKLKVYLGPDDAPLPSEKKAKAGSSAKRPSPVSKTADPPAGFSSPSPLGVPLVLPEDLEIIEEDDDESGWRKLITSPSNEQDRIIDLD